MPISSTQFIGLVLVMILAVAFPAAAATHTVGAGGDFATLTAAIGDPGVLSGDRLDVFPGTYSDQVLLNGKSLEIVSTSGSGSTTLSGGGATLTFDVREPDCRIEGFTITGYDRALSATTAATGLMVADLVILNHQTSPLFIPADLVAAIVPNVTLNAQGTFDAIYVRGSSIRLGNVTWPLPPAGFVYRISGTISVYGASGDPAPILTIDDGSVVKLDNYASIRVGQSYSGGIVANNVIFTSDQDDTEVGDTNGDGAVPVASNRHWNRIYIDSAATMADVR